MDENAVVSKRDGDKELIQNIYVRYFLSSMLAILCSSVSQIVGNIIIGNVIDSERLAVISLTMPIYYIFATIGNLAGIGGSTLCASYVGGRREADSKKAYTATYIFTVVSCLVFSVILLIFLPKVIGVLGSTPELYDDMYGYSIVMVIGGVFTALVYLSFNFLRLDGKGVATTFTFVIMAAVNIIFDIILTMVVPLGVIGVSIATSLGALAASIFGVVMIAKNSSILGFMKLSRSEFHSYTRKVMRIGSPGASENISIFLKTYLMNLLIIAMVGAGALSTLTIVNSVNSFATAIIAGAGGALLPLVGVFQSERDTKNTASAIKTSIIIGMAFIVVFICLVCLYTEPIAVLFGVKSYNINATVYAIRIFCLSLPFSLLGNILIYHHMADKHTFIANFTTIMRNFVMAIACAYMFMNISGEKGLWISFAACEISTLCITDIILIFVRLKNRDLSPIFLLDTSIEKKGRVLNLCVNDEEEELMKSVDSLRDFCESNEVSMKRSMLITLALEEMLTSVATHATRKSKSHDISIRVLLYQDVIILRLRYAGEMFDPIAYYESHKSNSEGLDAMVELEDSLGIKMIVDACDVVDYRTTFGINNLTVIV